MQADRLQEASPLWLSSWFRHLRLGKGSSTYGIKVAVLIWHWLTVGSATKIVAFVVKAMVLRGLLKLSCIKRMVCTFLKRNWAHNYWQIGHLLRRKAVYTGNIQQ